MQKNVSSTVKGSVHWIVPGEYLVITAQDWLMAEIRVVVSLELSRTQVGRILVLVNLFKTK